MCRIYKYPLKIEETQLVILPDNAKILTVQMVGENPYLWAEIDTEEKPRERFIHTIPTGVDFDVHGVYLGTYQLHRGILIYHVYIGVWN